MIENIFQLWPIIPLGIVGGIFIGIILRPRYSLREKIYFENEAYRFDQIKESLRTFWITKKDGEYVVNVEHMGLISWYNDMTLYVFTSNVDIELKIDMESILDKVIHMKPERTTTDNGYTQKIINDAQNNRLIGGKIHDGYVEFYWGGELEWLHKVNLHHQLHIRFDERSFGDRDMRFELGITNIKYFSTTTWKEIPKPQNNLTIESPYSIPRGFA